MNKPEPQMSSRPRRIIWKNVLTVVSAAILISAEVFGAAFAGSWAIANLLALGSIGARMLDGKSRIKARTRDRAASSLSRAAIGVFSSKP